MNNSIKIIVLLYFLFSYGYVAAQRNDGLSGSVRFVYLDRNFEQSERNRTQSGLGLIFGYQSPLYFDKFGFGIFAHAAEKLHASGSPTEDVFILRDGKVSNHFLFGEAYLDFKPVSSLSFRFGRQRYNAMMLNSRVRALPSTFHGITGRWIINDNISSYLALFNRWSRRANDKFEGFATDISKPGAIDYLFVVGGEYSLNALSLKAEYLRSDDYLQKFGLIGKYQFDFGDKTIDFLAGLFHASDAGDLFAVGAERGELDYAPNAKLGQPQNYESWGSFIGSGFRYKDTKFEVFFSKIKEPWLEDNYSGDHGTNPFPQKIIGPDLLNKNEAVWVFKIKQDWSQYLLNSFKTDIGYANGYGAENSISRELGYASENWFTVDLRYKPIYLKDLEIRLRYRDYQSSERGSVQGVKGDSSKFHFYINYAYQF